jgi:flagellar biosynthesis/type III secretory pathway ATPase
MVIMSAANTLAGKKAVVFDLAMADKVLPQKATGTDGGGGLVGAVIGAAGNAADLKNFNDAVTSESWLTQEQEALARKQVALFETFNARYAG